MGSGEPGPGRCGPVGPTAAVVIVYAADATALCASPLATAIAFIVSVAETVIAAVYFAEAVVGVVPFVV